MIELENIEKRYGKKAVLSDINMKFRKGKLTVLIGPSGCGKTTLLKLMNRLVRPSKGTIKINGKNIAKQSPIALRRNTGYVIQQTGLFPHMTVRENIEIIPKLQKKSKKDINERTLELMEMVGLESDSYLDRFPTQLSGGQQQRIGVARAFACDPDVILMDEPFSALDPVTKLQLQDELVKLQDELNKTIVFVTHDMDEAVRVGDYICIMNEGRIVQYDVPEEIMKHPADDFAEEFIGKNRIWSSPELIHAQDIMLTNPVCVPPTLSAFRCIERMASRGVDRLLITDRSRKLLGIVRASQIQKLKDKSIPVSNIMITDYYKANLDENIVEVLTLLDDHHLSVIPVLDNTNTLHGIVTKSSLVATLSEQYIEENDEENSQEEK